MGTTNSPDMNLPIPNVGSEQGPQYAIDINNCLTLIDAHDHTPGRGVQITPLGMNINLDLSFNSNNALSLRSSRYVPQSAPLSGSSDLGCVYVSGVDLYYNDVGGNQIRLTQGGSPAGGAGSISGLPSGTASASYSGGTFIFQSATNTAANIDGASFLLRNSSANSKALTLSPPNAMGSNFGITLPSLPSVKGIITIDSSGTMNVEPSPPSVSSLITVDTSGNLGTQPVSYNVTVGTGGTYSTIGAAITAVSADTNILVLSGTYTENVVIDKRLNIQGQGYGTVISGTLEFASGADLGLFQTIRVTGDISIDLNVAGVQIIDFWTSASATITDNGTGSFIQGMQY